MSERDRRGVQYMHAAKWKFRTYRLFLDASKRPSWKNSMNSSISLETCLSSSIPRSMKLDSTTGIVWFARSETWFTSSGSLSWCCDAFRTTISTAAWGTTSCSWICFNVRPCADHLVRVLSTCKVVVIANVFLDTTSTSGVFPHLPQF